MELYGNKNISINCPKCGGFMTNADSRDTETHKMACPHCRKWIWFIPANDYREVKDIPARTASSGKRFY